MATSAQHEEGRSAAGPVVWCLASAMLFGASTPASKFLLGEVGPLWLAGLLYAGAALSVAPRALRALPSRASITRSDLLHLGGAVVFGGIVGPVLLLSGLAIAPAASVSLWLVLETVATAVLAALFFKEHLTARTWLSVALVVAGSAMLSSGEAGSGRAVLLVSLACLAWGLDNNLTAVIDRFTPAQVTFAKGVAAATVNLGAGALLEGGSASAVTIGGGLLVGALSYGASLLLYVASAQQLGATRSQLVFSTSPAWGLLLSWLFLGERLTAAHLGASALMGAAIWLWHNEQHTHRHVHHAVSHQHMHRHDDGHHDHAHDTPCAPDAWHTHEHSHDDTDHAHEHRPDLHHRHEH